MTVHAMRRKDRELTDKDEIKAVLIKGKYATIAMCRQNEPYIFTLSYGFDGIQDALYFHCALQGLKLDFVRENPDVCATVIIDGGYQPDHCAHCFESAVIRGKMTIVENLEIKKHALDVILRHLEENPAPIKARTIQDNSAYENVTVLQLKIMEITGKKGS